MKLTLEEKQFLIEKIAAGETLPDDFQELLFPTTHKEYELRYAGKIRKEDLLADQDGTFAVPLQIEKIYNGERSLFDDGWQNMIVFGDNLQFLKTLYADKDELIRGKVKGKVKFIYIDPPFGTGDEYDGNKGQRAYSAKTKGAEFVEFIRRRLILAKDLLAPDGTIMVRQGYNFGHYIKVILDEVFEKNNFINEIIVNRGAQSLGGTRKYNTATDSIFFYSKSPNYFFKGFKRERYKGEPTRTNLYMGGERKPRERDFIDPDGKKVTLIPPTNTHWKFIQTKIDEMYKNGAIYLHFPKEGKETGIMKVEGKKLVPVNFVPRYVFDTDKTVNSDWTDIPGYSKEKLYPTQNSEELLQRAILTATQEGDIVMDFFGGSGTTAVVAEKLGRRWITCDIGKLSFYTMQKRMLTIQDGKSLVTPKQKYGKQCMSFITVNTGLYDIEKLRELETEKYTRFVLDLFEVTTKPHKINGVQLHGLRKDDYSVLVWNFLENNAKIDEIFLENLHRNVGKRIGKRLYIIAPANAVQFIGDYHEIDDVRYYFLKIPYQIIKELHREPFSKFRQPQSKSKINDLENAIGFHFMRQPEVESGFKNGELRITKFIQSSIDETTGRKFENFETLALILWDSDYNGREFTMTNYCFAEDLVHVTAEHTDEDVQQQLKEQKNILIPIAHHGTKLFVVYIDIFGNEFKQEIKAN